ncbi:MAG: KGK domain-containing protein [Scytonema sp. PMC 1070.18]|nr:KGK domain-containing protein [Scytonema sp. PMC 1070.18]
MLHEQYKRLDREDEFILIDKKVFNAVQIINQVIQDFEPKGNDLKPSCKATFIKKYFKQKNVHGIFNRVEWQFSLRKGVKCELLSPDRNGREQGKLEIKVIIDFSLSRKQSFSSHQRDRLSNSLSVQHDKCSENLGIKVSLDFCPNEPEEENLTNTSNSSSLNNVYWLANQRERV